MARRIVLSSEATPRSFGRRDVQVSGVAPETFQIVVGPSRCGENMHDEVAVIGQDPFGILIAFDAERKFSEFGKFLAHERSSQYVVVVLLFFFFFFKCWLCYVFLNM